MHLPFLARNDTARRRPGLGLKGMAIAAAAIAAPLIAISAAGALTGNDTVGAPVAAVTAAAESLLASDTPVATATTTTAATDGNNDNDSADETGTAGASPSASASATGSAAAAAAHSNVHGCDDVLFTDGTKTPTPGGPADCTVGSSASHRQNGEQKASTSTSTATTSAALATSTPSPQDQADPHKNGNGCDDVLFKDGTKTPSPGDPVGCTVGNSADHRQNGLHGQATTAATDTTTPAVLGTAPVAGVASGQNSQGGGSGGRGNGNSNGSPPGNGRGSRK
jgi:hypothetical protein